MNDVLSVMNQFGEKVPQDNTRRYNDIKRVLGAKLRDFDTSVYHLHYSIADAIYLIAKNKCIFFSFGRLKLIEHYAFLSLLNGNYFIAILA